jgi:glycosyltransferase involved in cell wall biosynthesis
LSEGQNLALAEAAASGVLMAGTKVGLLYDLDDTYAIRVDIGDYHALATHVLKEVNDPEKWDFKIHRAREWVEQHSLDWTVEQLKTHLKYYRS